MSIRALWAEVRKRLYRWGSGGEPTLSEILRERYVHENQHRSLLKMHAAQMSYVQLRENLLRIADEEIKHIEWLGKTLLALGEELPQAPAMDDRGLNSWERLLMDFEEERRCAADLSEQLITLRSQDPEIVAGLESILADARRHREELREMLMRSDPFTDQAA